MTTLAELRHCLSDWPNTDIPANACAVKCHERLRILLQAVQKGDAIGWGDLAGCLRHSVLHDSFVHEDAQAKTVTVPKVAPWPTRAQWAQFGFRTEADLRIQLRLRADIWRPDWLAGSDSEIPFEDAFRETVRRGVEPVPGDICIADVLGARFGNYRSEGQREAIRALFCLKAGRSIIVNLPTGTGKSLASWAPAMLNAAAGKMTLVIVPTIALALDQAAQVKAMFSHVRGIDPQAPLAWHSGLSEEDRSLVKMRVSNGQQTILFTSPEAAMSSLTHCLFKAAENERLGHFVIDEAHMISSWGSDFRPEFQALSGLWGGLLNRCPTGRQFKTVFLTATLTQDTDETIRALFTRTGEIASVSHAFLRPEPSYWTHGTSSSDDKQTKVLEIASRCPRPFILYVTKQADAEEYCSLLKQRLGITCADFMHGGTCAERRKSILERWKCNELDVVVATSAFGLGMDKDDVRCVVHACVPESVDRYYQEVGRGGRDGKACTCILAYTSEDLVTARSLSRDRLISSERGQERWSTMWTHREDRDEGYELHLWEKPSGIDQDSEANESWNLRTVLLLARAGALKLSSRPPPINVEDDGGDELDRYFKSVIVSEPHQSINTRAFWKTIVQSLRHASSGVNTTTIERMVDVLEATRPIDEILCETYSCASVEFQPRLQSGGNCSYARKMGIGRGKSLPYLCNRIPEGHLDIGLQPVAEVLGNRLVSRDLANPVFLTFSPELLVDSWRRHEWDHQIIGLLRWFIQQNGVKNISVSARLAESSEFRELGRCAASRFFVMSPLDSESDIAELSHKLPRLCVLENQDMPEHLLRQTNPVNIIVARSDTTGDQPFRTFFDLYTSMPLKAFLTRIGL